MSQALIPRIRNLPVGLFASVMGIVGLGLAWREAAQTFPIACSIGEAIIAVGIAVYVLLGVGYALKAKINAPAIRAEFAHAEQVNLFATIPIGAMLIAIALLPYDRAAAEAVLIPAALLTCALTVLIIGRWLRQRQSIEDVNPSWFMAVMGNVLVPIGAMPLGYYELSWMFFSIGILFWPPMLAIILYRVFFHGPLSPREAPTVLIFLGPPTAAFIAYQELVGGLDGFARFLFYSGAFFGVIVAALSSSFRGIPYSVSWWAFTFPMDALAICFLYYYREVDAPAIGAIAITAVGLATLSVAVVATATVRALIRGAPLMPLTDQPRPSAHLS